MLLSVLPDEERTDLSEFGFPGLVAVWRPVSVEEKARWWDSLDLTLESPITNVSRVALVRLSLIRIEGLDAEEVTDGVIARVPFSGQNPTHYARLPLGIILALYLPIVERTSLKDDDRKNSG